MVGYSRMQRGNLLIIGLIRAGAVSQQNIDNGTEIVSRGEVKRGMTFQVSFVDRCTPSEQDAYTINIPTCDG